MTTKVSDSVRNLEDTFASFSFNTMGGYAVAKRIQARFEKTPPKDLPALQKMQEEIQKVISIFSTLAPLEKTVDDKLKDTNNSTADRAALSKLKDAMLGFEFVHILSSREMIALSNRIDTVITKLNADRVTELELKDL